MPDSGIEATRAPLSSSITSPPLACRELPGR